jgi:hypothetical protein
MSIMKLMIPSMHVRARMRAFRDPLRVALTASTYCLFALAARKRGMLAALVAACWAALQPTSKFPRASAMASWAETEELFRRKIMKSRERIGYASQVRDSRYGRVKYGLRVEA